MSTVILSHAPGKRVKIHACESDEITVAVKRDLKARGVEKFTEIFSETIGVDFGGAKHASAKPRQIPGISVCYLDQDYSLFRQAVLEATQRENLYYKIHDNRALCLCPETYETVKSYLVENEEELKQAENAARAQLTGAITSMLTN